MAHKSLPSRARLSYAYPGDPLHRLLLISIMEWMTGRRRLEKLYTELKQEAPPGAEVWRSILGKLQITPSYDAALLAKAPAEGPVIFLANHPFGVVDGLALGYLLAQVREDFLVLVNGVLCQEEMLLPFVLPVDFRETKEALHTNLQTRRRAQAHLLAGGALGIFPAGGVATAAGGWGKARDLEWKRFVAKLIQQTQATVIPLYFHGQNSRLFQLVSQFSQDLRLSLLLSEVRNKMGRPLHISVGTPIPYPELAGIRNRQELLDRLRALTFALADP